MTTLRVEQKLSFNDFSEAEWNALSIDTPFNDHRFLLGLEQAGCLGPETGWIQTPIGIYAGDELVGAAPLFLKTNSEGEFVYDFSWAEVYARYGRDYYPKVVIGAPFSPATGRRLLTRGPLQRELAGAFAEALRAIATQYEASSVHVLFARAEEVSLLSEFGFFTRLGVQYHFRQPTPFDFEDYVSTLASKKRTQVRKEWKSLRERGFVFRPVERPTQEDIDTMFRFYERTVEQYFPYTRRYLTRAFFDRLVQTMPECIAWLFAEKDGVPVAGAMNLKGSDALYGRYWGTDVNEAFLHFGTCYYAGIEYCSVKNLPLFEPGAGGEHKRARGFQPSLTYSSHWMREPPLHAMFSEYVGRERDHIQRHLHDE